MKEGMEITDFQVCLLLAMHMNPHERGYSHNYIHVEICKRPIFFFFPFPRFSLNSSQSINTTLGRRGF